MIRISHGENSDIWIIVLKLGGGGEGNELIWVEISLLLSQFVTVAVTILANK